MAPVDFSFSVIQKEGYYILERNGISITCDVSELEETKKEFPSFYWEKKKEVLRNKLYESQEEKVSINGLEVMVV